MDEKPSMVAVYDPMDVQLSYMNEMLKAEQISVDELVQSPVAIKLLLRQQNVYLYQLKAYEDEMGKLRSANSRLQLEREELRVGLAELQERHIVSLIEIPIGIASGFAINMLTEDIASREGWLLFVLSLVLLLYLRRVQIANIFRRGKELSHEAED